MLSTVYTDEALNGVTATDYSRNLYFNSHFSRWTWVSRYQNVSIIDILQCFDTVWLGDRKGICPVKSWALIC